MRKLASIRRISAIEPIDGADSIELATIDGWKVVIKKGDFDVDDQCIYFEIDSWIPHEFAPFLSKGNEPKEYEGIKGERLRTIKLKGQLSQGLILPTCIVEDIVSPGECFVFDDGSDVTELLNIKKWEPIIPTHLSGEIKGNFPSLVPKTDQERCQNLIKQINNAIVNDYEFEVTEKLDGSSATFFLDQSGEFHICSRNLSLKYNDANAFCIIADRYNIHEKMKTLNLYGYAIQGELIGPSIQSNKYKLPLIDFYVFDIYDTKKGSYLNSDERQIIVKDMKLKHVPILSYSTKLDCTINIDSLLKFAEGKSKLNLMQEREGVVFKQICGKFTFKAISNKFLLKEN